MERKPPIVANLSSYQTFESSLSSESSDHLSLGFGVGVGLPFVANASVHGQYTRIVTENRDENKTSVKASVRAGDVRLLAPPTLTNEAKATIKYNGGIPGFHQKYGNYYVAGYWLGGDTGLTLSAGSQSRSTLESFTVKATVKVLIFSKSKSWTKHEASSSSFGQLNMAGYDTLSKQCWQLNRNSTPTMADADRMEQQTITVMMNAHSLNYRVQEGIDELKLTDETRLSQDDCIKIIRSGLVVELILLPVENIQETFEWNLDDNILYN